MPTGVLARRGRCPSCRYVFTFPVERPPKTCPRCRASPQRRTNIPPDDLRRKSPKAIAAMSRLELAQATDHELSRLSADQYEAYRSRLSELARRDAWMWAISGSAIAVILFILLPALI